MTDHEAIEPPDWHTWPPDAFAWCVTCHRFITVGQAYRKMAPGKFSHAGPCLVIKGGRDDR